jgi:lantibiotic modifying enzyme
MFLKILILDVHRQKNFGNLKGSTPKEQYDYYEKKYLNNATYVKSLLQEYPELKRLLELKNNSIQRAECEIFMQKKNRYKKYSVMEESFPGLWEFTCRKAIHTEEDEVWQR